MPNNNHYNEPNNYSAVIIGLSLFAALIAALAASTSMANSALSAEKSGSEILTGLESYRGEDANESIWNVLNFVSSAFVIFYAVSLFYQRFTKNYPKVDKKFQTCSKRSQKNSLPESEQDTTQMIHDTDSKNEDDLLTENTNALNYTIYKKAPPSKLRKAINLGAFAAEIALGAFSASTLLANIESFFTDDPSPALNVFNYALGGFAGLSSAVIFYIINAHQNNFYDEASLLRQRLNEIPSTFARLGAISATTVLKHFIVSLSIISGELGDYTTFEVIQDTLFSTDNPLLNVIAFLACLNIAACKYSPYSDKFDGAWFALSRGKVYADMQSGTTSTAQDTTNADNLITQLKKLMTRFKKIIDTGTFSITILGTLYKNICGTAYQVAKLTGNPYLAIGAAAVSGICSSAMTGVLLHDSSNVPPEQQTEGPPTYPSFATDACSFFAQIPEKIKTCLSTNESNQETTGLLENPFNTHPV